jgi:Parvulin-like peptidyl-prolyl isomerase
MKKRLKASILICLAVMILAVPLNARIVDRIVAVVNDEIVTLSELNSAVEPYLKKIDKLNKGENREKVAAQTMSAMLDKLINDILVKQEAKRLGIVVKEEDIAKTVEDVILRRKITTEDFKKALAREGSSFPAYKKEVEEHLMKIRLVGASVKSKVSVTDEEIGDYYRKHREDYEGKEAVRIKQILIIVPKRSGMEERLRLKADAGLIHKRLMGGESFEFLADNYSNGPAAKLGGRPWFCRKRRYVSSSERSCLQSEKWRNKRYYRIPCRFSYHQGHRQTRRRDKVTRMGSRGDQGQNKQCKD